MLHNLYLTESNGDELKLKNEYNRLFSSVFNNPERMKMLVEFLSQRSSGYTRKEIIENTDAKDGGMEF